MTYLRLNLSTGCQRGWSYHNYCFGRHSMLLWILIFGNRRPSSKEKQNEVERSPIPEEITGMHGGAGEVYEKSWKICTHCRAILQRFFLPFLYKVQLLLPPPGICPTPLYEKVFWPTMMTQYYSCCLLLPRPSLCVMAALRREREREVLRAFCSIFVIDEGKVSSLLHFVIILF
jgi:hypothetical protein